MLQLGEEGRAQPKGVPGSRLDPPTRKTSWFIAPGMLGLSVAGTGEVGEVTVTLSPSGGWLLRLTACTASPQ